MIFTTQKYVMIKFDIRLLVHRKVENIIAKNFIALPINMDHIRMSYYTKNTMKRALLGAKREFDKMRTFQFISFQFCIIMGVIVKKLRLNILKPSLNVGCINKKLDR